MPPVLLHSALLAKVETRLLAPFSAMTTFFIRRSVEKAFQLDEPPSDLTLSLLSPVSTLSNPPFITSAVDDVMYIIKTHLQRTIHTSLRALVTAVISTIGRVLGSDFVGMIQRKMQVESYPKATSGAPGALPPDEKIVSFLILINNLDVASEYNSRIISGFLGTTASDSSAGGIALEEQFPFADDARAVRDALKGMEATFESKAGELINDGIMVFFNQVVKPKLRPLLTDAFRDVEYIVSDAGEETKGSGARGYDEDTDEDGTGGGVEDEEIVKHRFQSGWDAVMIPYKRVLTEKCFNKLLNTTAAYFTRLLEKRIWGYSGRINELGAIRLERDVAGVVGVVVRGGMYGVRDAFARCVQICLVVNMEEDEVSEMLSGDGDGVEWKLEVDERRRARGMVVGKG